MNVVLQTHSQKTLTWTANADNTTMADLWNTIRQVVPGHTNGSETIMMQHTNSPGDSLEPITSDDHLRMLLWVKIGSGA